MRKNATIIARVPIGSLQILVDATSQLPERVYTPQIKRAIRTVMLAVKKEKLRKGVFD